MNKTLLLILVDFLLLTLLSMTKWDEERPTTPSDAPVGEYGMSSLAVMEQDMLDTLESSLEEEREAQQELAEAMQEREEALEKQEDALRDVKQEAQERASQAAALAKTLEERDSALKTVEQENVSLKGQSEKLQNEVLVARRAADQTESAYQDLELQAKQSQAQARQLQSELKEKLDQIAQKDDSLKQLAEEKAETESMVQELGVQVRLVEEEKKYLRENLVNLKNEVEVVREEKQVLQAQTGMLAEGVTQLAESSENIKKEIRSNTPINANQLYNAFLGNQVTTTYLSQRYYDGRVLEKTQEVKTLLVSDGSATYALTHVARTPLEISRRPDKFRRLEASFGAKGELKRIDTIEFLAIDPRVAAVKVGDAQKERLGMKSYLTAIDPYKFEKAVLINSQGNYYGEVEFKLDSRTPGYVKMESKITDRLFGGKFSPSTGDLVLSKTGELLGIMVDRSYCLVIDTLLTRERATVGPGFRQSDYEQTVKALRANLSRLPSQVR